MAHVESDEVEMERVWRVTTFDFPLSPIGTSSSRTSKTEKTPLVNAATRMPATREPHGHVRMKGGNAGQDVGPWQVRPHQISWSRRPNAP